MTERLEYFGRPTELPEPKIVGDCWACGGEMYRSERTNCPICGREIHESCRERCENCGIEGCKKCLVKVEVYFLCGDECKKDWEN